MDYRSLSSLLDAGVDLKTSLSELNARELPADVELAIELGAPLKTLLISLAIQQESGSKAKAELAQAMAMPKATKRLLLWLPVLTLALTFLTGISSLDSLTNPLVIVAILLGSALLYVGHRISRRMLLTLDENFDIADLQKFAIAIACGLTTGQIANRFPDLLTSPKVARLVSLTNRTGAALSKLVSSEIENGLQAQLSEKIAAARVLSVRLLIPLGLTTLPAFMLFTIPPTLVGLTN
jgi:tight adherence protein B